MKTKIINSYPEGVKFYKDAKGDWRWKITATNNEIIGASSEGFINKYDCESNFLMVGKSISATKIFASFESDKNDNTDKEE